MTPTGPDLSTWLGEHGPPGTGQAVLFCTELADRLARLHMAGMVHASLSTARTRVEAIDGRIYPAPFDRPVYQQATGPTPADDVYALGMMLRALLDTDTRSGAAGPLPALLALADRCTATDPAGRPTAAAVAQDLRSIGRDLLLGLAPEPVEPVATTPGYVPVAVAETPPAPTTHRRRVLLLAVAGAVLLVTVAAGAVALLDRHPDPADHRVSASAAPGEPGTGGASADPSASRVPPRRDPIGQPYLMRGSEVGLNEASGHGCRAWLTGSNPGPWVQAAIDSSGDDCEMALWRSRNGGHTYAILSGVHRIHAGTDSTMYYWAGDVFVARVCLLDHSTGQSGCGTAFGGGASPSAGSGP